MLQVQIEDLGVIRFIAPPSGSAPLAIREAWIGVEAPCLFSHDGKPQQGDTMHDVMHGFDVPDYPGYILLQVHALEALAEKSPAAVRFWKEHGFPNHQFALFLFSHESAEIVKPVPTREEFFRRYADA